MNLSLVCAGAFKLFVFVEAVLGLDASGARNLLGRVVHYSFMGGMADYPVAQTDCSREEISESRLL